MDVNIERRQRATKRQNTVRIPSTKRSQIRLARSTPYICHKNTPPPLLHGAKRGKSAVAIIACQPTENPFAATAQQNRSKVLLLEILQVYVRPGTFRTFALSLQGQIC